MKDPKNQEHDSEQTPETPESQPGHTKEDPKHPGVNREERGSRPPSNDDSKRPWKRISKTLAFWVFFLLVAIFASKFFASAKSPL